MAFCICICRCHSGIALSTVRTDRIRFRVSVLHWIFRSGAALLRFNVPRKIFIWIESAVSIFTSHALHAALAAVSCERASALGASLMAIPFVDRPHGSVRRFINPSPQIKRLGVFLHGGMGIFIFSARRGLLSFTSLRRFDSRRRGCAKNLALVDLHFAGFVLGRHEPRQLVSCPRYAGNCNLHS